MALHNQLGIKGEMLAARYLQNEGFAIREFNWRSGHKEIDLIAQERDVLVFVEVKIRKNENFGNPLDSITDKKIEHLILAAENYMQKNKINLRVRFDVVSILGDTDIFELEHIRDAFSPTLYLR